MWAFRRASAQLRNQGLNLRTSQICCGRTGIARCCSESYNAGVIEPQEKISNGLLSSTRFYSTSFRFLKSQCEVRTFSSQVGAKSDGEDDDLEDSFSELGTPQDTAVEAISEDDNDDDLGSEFSEEEGIDDDVLTESEALDTGIGVGEKKSSRTRASSAMTKAILAAPALPVSKVLNKWVEEGNEVTPTEVSLTMLRLRKRRLFVKALQFSEWLESTKRIEFGERNYASRVDLIAKVQGIFKAESYIEKIPQSCRSEIVYRTLLANCVITGNMKKSEKLFNKMKDLGFPISCFSCNQLLLLYKRVDRKKVADVLLLMEKEDIKPSIFTYQILIDVKGQAKDLTGMEQILETMKAEGLEPSAQIQASLARSYAAGGLKDKAEAVLKEMEGDDIKKNRWVCQLVIPIYAYLGKEDEVERVWKVCESDPRLIECMAAIGAWGRLKKIEKAEAAFERMLKKMKKPSSKHFTSLLRVYAHNKMLAKGKDLVKRMAESGCMLGPLAWDALVKLYAGAGEVEKADSILMKASKQSKSRPLYASYTTIMEKYSERGDIHKCEKIFQMMKQAGYSSRIRQYELLLQAYINAKIPAYGFTDRMKADNIFPSKSISSQLARANAFRKSAVAELLE